MYKANQILKRLAKSEYWPALWRDENLPGFKMIEEIKKGEGEMIQLFFKNIFCTQKIKVERVRPRKKKKLSFWVKEKSINKTMMKATQGVTLGGQWD